MPPRTLASVVASEATRAIAGDIAGAISRKIKDAGFKPTDNLCIGIKQLPNFDRRLISYVDSKSAHQSVVVTMRLSVIDVAKD